MTYLLNFTGLFGFLINLKCFHPHEIFTEVMFVFSILSRGLAGHWYKPSPPEFKAKYVRKTWQ